MAEYRGHGECMVKQYVQFTHVCTVSDYVPSIDHCCCVVNDDALLCCRYHQDWYHFRCMDAQDQLLLRYTVPQFPARLAGWLGSRVVSVLDSGAEGPGFKSQPRRCRRTVLGKLFTPVVPLFTEQQNW